MMKRRFIQCDVFTDVPTKGNGLAVIIDGEGLSDGQMQSFAAWTNLAETTFLFPPTHKDADYKVRIFTPKREMPFAGHPTLGSCTAWLKAGGKANNEKVFIQECGVGLVTVHQQGDGLAFEAPPTTISEMPSDMLDAVVSAMGLGPDVITAAAVLDNGPVWQAFRLKSAADVLAVDSSKIKWPNFQGIGLIGPHASGGGFDYEVRMLAPSSGMSEDPITGSLNAALAKWMLETGDLPNSMTVSQGVCIGRKGKVTVTRDRDDPSIVKIGGETHILIEGSVEL